MFNQGNDNFFKSLSLIVTICIFMLLNGCASRATGFSPDLLDKQLGQGSLRQKTDRLLVVIDGRGGLDLRKAYRFLREVEKMVPPAVHYEKVFRIYGWEIGVFSDDVSALFGLHELPYQGIEEMVVTRILPDSNITPLSLSLDSLVMELAEVEGHNALIIISNGRQISEDAIQSARYLKRILAGKVCFYPILMGDDSAGEKRLETLPGIGKCGYMRRYAELQTPTGVTDFVRDIFFATVKDISVEKPGLETKQSLDEMLGRDKKIQFVLHVEFEFDKAKILPGFNDEMKQVVDFLKTYPETVAQLVGHTDSIGSENYNHKLSLERAKGVRRYLIDNFGIDEKRLIFKGVGESEPVADNSSAAGRQRNRRVVAVITRQVKEFNSQ